MINLKVEYYGNPFQSNYFSTQRVNEVLNRRDAEDFYLEDNETRSVLDELKDYSTYN